MMRQLSWFVVVGGCAAFTHFIVLLLSVQYLSITPGWGNVIGFCCAFIISFSGHYVLTFSAYKNTEQVSATATLWRWLFSSLGAFFLNQLLFVMALEYIGDVYYLFIWFVVTGVVTMVSFLLGKFWAFRHAPMTNTSNQVSNNDY